mgnify:FL=1
MVWIMDFFLCSLNKLEACYVSYMSRLTLTIISCCYQALDEINYFVFGIFEKGSPPSFPECMSFLCQPFIAFFLDSNTRFLYLALGGKMIRVKHVICTSRLSISVVF